MSASDIFIRHCYISNFAKKKKKKNTDNQSQNPALVLSETLYCTSTCLYRKCIRNPSPTTFWHRSHIMSRLESRITAVSSVPCSWIYFVFDLLVFRRMIWLPSGSARPWTHRESELRCRPRTGSVLAGPAGRQRCAAHGRWRRRGSEAVPPTVKVRSWSRWRPRREKGGCSPCH